MSDEPLLQARKDYIKKELDVLGARVRRLEDNLREAEAGLPSARIQEEIDSINDSVTRLQQEYKNLQDLKINQGAIGERLTKIPKAIEALQRERSAGIELLRHMRSKEMTGDRTKDEIINKEINLRQKIAQLKTGIAEFNKQLTILEGEQSSYLEKVEIKSIPQIENVGEYKPPL